MAGSHPCFPLLLVLLRHQLPQPPHHLLRAGPGDRDRLELPGHGLVGLRDQPVHGEVSPGEGHIPGAQGECRAEVVGSVPDVEDPLVGATSLLHPARHVVPDHHLLAHVGRATLALVRVEGPQHQAAVLVEGGRVGEDPVEELARPVAPQPRVDEEGVGVGQQHHLEVLLRAGAQELQKGGHARRGRQLLHHAADVALGHALLGQVGQHPLHVLIVAAGLVGVLQPGRQVLPGGHLHHNVIAGLVHDGLVKVEEDEEALVVGDVCRLRGHDVGAPGPGRIPLAWGVSGDITTVEE